VHEVAPIVRVSKMTVYRLVHSGHLAAIRVGRSFRVPVYALREYLGECIGVSTFLNPGVWALGSLESGGPAPSSPWWT
jgi:excisionase family DNA binding protein